MSHRAKGYLYDILDTASSFNTQCMAKRLPTTRRTLPCDIKSNGS